MNHDVSLRERCETLDAFETDPWAAEAILEGEILTPNVIDPNIGLGVLTRTARARGYRVHTADIYDWSRHFDCEAPQHIADWTAPLLANPFADIVASGDFTVYMNSPFKLSCEFLDRAKEMGARKIVSFQRWAWRESIGRDEWWEKNPPARIWICADRASCYRFDIPATCPNPGTCRNQITKKRVEADQCRECLSGSTTAHAWFVWERGHKGAEIICTLRRARGRT